MKKKLTKIFTLALALSLFLVACGNDSGNEDTGQNNDNVASDGEYKDTLIFAQNADITSLDPHVGKETPAVTVTQQIFDTLTTFDENGDVQPQIAESWEQPDNTTTVFKIREGIKFHDGSDLTADDVKFSLDRAVASSHVAYIVNFIENVEVTGDMEVTVSTKEPYAPILRNLAVPFSAIVPKAYVEELEANGEEFANKPVGSGPYKFVEWNQGNNCKLEAFADYYSGEAATKYIEMRVIPDATQRTNALEAGDIDLAYTIQPNDIAKIEENSDLVFVEPDPLTLFYLCFNTNKEPLDNKLVRQAIAYAIDSQIIIDTMMYGRGSTAGDLIAPAVFGYAGSEPYPYDVEKAKELMAEAGYADGFSIKLAVNEDQSRVEVCSVIQDMLKEINIEVELDVSEFSTFISSTSSGEHDMAYFGWVTSTLDADYTYYPLVHSSQAGAPGNRSFYDNPEADALVDQGRSVLDDSEREAIYAELETILHEDLPYAPLVYNSVNAGASAKVENFKADSVGYHKLDQVKVKK